MAKKDPSEKKEYEYVVKTFRAKLNDGTIKQIKVYGKDGKEAQKKLDRIKLEYEMGLIVFNRNTTFKKWAEEWLKVYKEPVMSEQEYTKLEHRIKNYFTSSLGGMRISDIRTAHLQACINELKGKSVSLQNKCLGAVNSIFERAIDNEIITKNPCRGLVLPKGTVKNRRALTAQEKEVFLKTLDAPFKYSRQPNSPHPFGNFFAIILGCGLRPGEVRALTWPNVDLKNGIIKVVAAAAPDSIEIKKPKTEAGFREVPIPNWLLNRLKGMPKNGLSYVFSDDKGQPITEQRYERAWKSFLNCMDVQAGAKTKKNEIILHAIDTSITPYYLRHTYATGLREAGVDIKTAQYLLGHSDIRMTLQVYTHVTPNMLEEARQKINAL